MRTRIHADGWLDVSDRRRVRMPGNHEVAVDPAPVAEALAFLLSHSFPGYRRVIRSMNEADRKLIQLAMWANSVNERMGLVDRVWRRITEPATPPQRPGATGADPGGAVRKRMGVPHLPGWLGHSSAASRWSNRAGEGQGIPAPGDPTHDGQRVISYPAEPGVSTSLLCR